MDSTLHRRLDHRLARHVALLTIVQDLEATILHLMGLDHERLTYRQIGRDFRLTDVSGRVIEEILASSGRRGQQESVRLIRPAGPIASGRFQRTWILALGCRR